MSNAHFRQTTTLIAALMITLSACKSKAEDVKTDPTDGLTNTTEPVTDSPTTTDPTTPPTSPTTLVRRHDCGGIEPADYAPLGGRIALTFDDGPDPIDTPAILDTLSAHNVPATFFALGENLAIESRWEIAERIVNDPLFELANHSWDHADLAGLSLAAAEAEIDDTTDVIESFGQSLRYVRFPYGSSNCATHDMVTERGHRVVGWHIDTGDWCYAAVGDEGNCSTDSYWRIPEEHNDSMLDWTIEQIERYDGGIVLLHDIHAWTADQMDEMIVELKARGFTFTSLDDADAFPNLNAGTYADLPYLGEPCNTTDDRCWETEFFAWCEPAEASGTNGICVMPCEGTCPDRDGAATTFCADNGEGLCLARESILNDSCALTPGTSSTDADRFIGSSTSDPLTLAVCWPDVW